jgi:hypothetical protein
MASIYPLRDNKPRFLALDAFVPYKNKGTKVRNNESEVAKKKRERLKSDYNKSFVMPSQSLMSLS